MRTIRSTTIALLLALTLGALLAAPLAAQALRGEVRDSTSHRPIPGAVITLLDSAGTVVGRNISDERGAYRVAYTRPARAVRVVRIGFLPLELAFTDPLARAASLNVSMIPFSTTLASVRVTDKSNCPRRPDRAVAFAYWEQARAGLLNTVVARESHPMSVHRLGFERTMDGNSDKITRFLVWEDSAANSQTSFNAVRTARDFVTHGFSTLVRDTTLMYGPDADVLLDDAFASGYCFHLADPSKARPTEIGLAFAPPDHRAGRIDIDGILWLDTLARSLRDIEFKYIGLPRTTEKFRPGGTISFRSVANGVSFIDRWSLRRVDAMQDTTVSAIGSGLTMRDFLYATENGGELAHARWPDGPSWDAALGTLRIRALNSAGGPAAGAAIMLPGTPYHADADSSGAIVITDLLPGPYSVRINDPRAAKLGFTLPTKLVFDAARDSTHRATLTVPTAEEYVASLCLKDRQWLVNDSTFILGRVIDAAGKSVNDVKVTFAYWSDERLEWVFEKWNYTTGTDGVFQSCSAGYTPGTKVLMHMSRNGRNMPDIVRDVTNNLTIVLVRAKGAP
jgi:hypothetical protein